MNDIAPYITMGGTKPPMGFSDKIHAVMRGIDNTNVNVFQFGKSINRNKTKTVAVSDFWKCYSFDPTSLDTQHVVDPYVPSGNSLLSGFPKPSSAHPMKEIGTDNYITFVSALNPIPWFSSSISLIRIISTNKRELITKWTVPRIPYMHSFALSRRFAVIFEHPIFVDVSFMLKTAEALDSLIWEPDLPTNVRVIEIKTGKIISMQTAAFMFMHHINSFEYKDNNGNDVIAVDFVTYPDVTFMKSLQLNVLKDRRLRDRIDPNSKIRRFHINLFYQTISIEEPYTKPRFSFATHLDMPVINEAYQGSNYSYVYGIVLKSDSRDVTNVTLVKKDVSGRGRDVAWFKKNHYPSEPWFLPAPNSKSEDDGLLLSLVFNGHRKHSYLALFDAKTMKRVNKAHLPSRIPMTLHGRFIDSH